MDTVILIAVSILTLASYLVGFLLPRIVKLAVRDLKGDDERVIITYLVCFIAAMVIDWKSLSSGDLQHIGQWFAFIGTQAHLSYKLYYKPKWESPEEVTVAQ